MFLAVGELALYVAYLDGWPTRHRIWPWATALIGLAVSVAGNIGHIQPMPGHPVLLADRLTAATSPLAAFAGLTVGLLVLRMNRRQATASPQAGTSAGRVLPLPAGPGARTGITRTGLLTWTRQAAQPTWPGPGSVRPATRRVGVLTPAMDVIRRCCGMRQISAKWLPRAASR